MQRTGSVVEEQQEDLEREREKVKTLLELFSTVVHDLRTPLTLAIGPLEALLRGECGKVGKGVQDQVGLALRNNRRLLQLATHLLEFSRLELGGHTVCCRRRDLNQFLSAIVDAFSFVARKKEINLNFTGSSCSSVFLDPEKMERAFFNIIGNAIKFTPRGGSVTVTVSEGIRHTHNNCVDVVVRDSGIGIHRKDLPHIFKRFMQATTLRTKKYEGTGLGLFLAKELIELQGGSIKVESTYGKGSAFTVCLPLRNGHTGAQFALGDCENELVVEQGEIELYDIDGRDKLREEKPTGGRRLVLFIDDNLEVRRFVSGIIKKEYEVITAENGVKGLAKLRHYVPDLIIADIIMPRMDGVQFLKTVKADPALKHIPLIFLTAKTDPVYKIEGLNEGADDYIVKPFNAQELLARVRAHLPSQAVGRGAVIKEEKTAGVGEGFKQGKHHHLIIGNSKPLQEIYTQGTRFSSEK